VIEGWLENVATFSQDFTGSVEPIQQFLNLANMIGQSGLYGRCNAKRLANPAVVVICECRRFLSVSVFAPAGGVDSYITGAGAAETVGRPVEIRGGILRGKSILTAECAEIAERNSENVHTPVYQWVSAISAHSAVKYFSREAGEICS
jgi:hypothetical protein